jgi:hypothetical protein
MGCTGVGVGYGEGFNPSGLEMTSSLAEGAEGEHMVAHIRVGEDMVMTLSLVAGNPAVPLRRGGRRGLVGTTAAGSTHGRS